jgi:hypothetical protein
MPGTANGVAYHQPLGERTAVVGADCAHSKELLAHPCQQHGLVSDVTSKHGTIGEGIRRDSLGQIRPSCAILLLTHISPPEDGSFRKHGQFVTFVKIILDFLVFPFISDTLE